MNDKLYLIQNKKVIGNFDRHEQIYNISILPQTLELPPKLILDIKTDVFNSLRFMHDSQALEFLEDLFISYLKFKEIKARPDYKEAFRIAQLETILNRLRTKAINEWKKEVLEVIR